MVMTAPARIIAPPAQPHGELYEAASEYASAFERVHAQEGQLHYARQAAHHHPECDCWVAAAANKLSVALAALDAALDAVVVAAKDLGPDAGRS